MSRYFRTFRLEMCVSDGAWLCVMSEYQRRASVSVHIYVCMIGAFVCVCRCTLYVCVSACVCRLGHNKWVRCSGGGG